MGRLYKVTETDDNLSFQRFIQYYMANEINVGGTYFTADQDVSSLVGGFGKALDAGIAKQGGDGLSVNHSWYVTKKDLSTWYPTAGVPIRYVDDYFVGLRWYFTPRIYVRVSALADVTQYNVQYKRVTLTYVKNGVTVGTITQDIRKTLDTSYENQSGQGASPLIPYNATMLGGTLPNVNRLPNKIISGMSISLKYAGNNKGFTITTNLSIADSPEWLRTFFDEVEPIDTDDPYINVPDSEPSGPAEGVGIPTTDSVDIPSTPTVSATDTGFVSLFNPTMNQVKDLADYMWAGLFDIATFKKIFADPMDCILGFNMVPVDVPSGSAAAVRVGNISTGVQMNKATSQWVELDCGTVTMDLPYGSYLDYSPYTKVSLYLPYIGMVELSTDDVMGRVLSLKYHVDVLSCACVAYLKCGPDVLYQFTGSCGYSIPITGDNFRQMISNIVSLAATIGGAVISGGAAVPVVTGAMTAKQAAKAAAKAAAMKQAQAAATIGAAESAAHTVMGSKPDVHRSGALGSSAGLMGIQKPFLIMEIPNACKPKKQYHYLGYPGFITVTVGDLTGYAEFESIILDGIPCTEDERDQIASLCAGGIYL